MITGVRLTQLANGEPLLGSSWSYNDLYGVEAVEKRLEDLFYFAKLAGFNTIIDTIKPQLGSDGKLTLDNNGLYANQWTLYRRLELYQRFSIQSRIDVMLEIDFPGIITDTNYIAYSDFLLSLLKQYPFIKAWQVTVNPETLIGNVNPQYKCDPVTYVKMMQYIYPIVKQNYSSVKIGGPGIYQGLIDYFNEEPENWLSIAVGDHYSQNGTYQQLGMSGFLNYIDFFSIQGKQDTAAMNYNIFPTLIDNLNEMFIRKTSTTIKIYSLVQGWRSFSNNSTSLNEQAYYELREILNCFKKEIVPFKHQLVDEFDNSEVSGVPVDPNSLGYGLIYYYAGNNGFKPAYNDYTFLLKNLSGYTTVVPNRDIIDVDPANKDNIEILTLSNDDGSQLASIIWPKTLSTAYVTLKPHYARSYLFVGNDQAQSIINPTQIDFKDHYFLIVYEQLGLNKVNVDELEKMINKKLSTTENILASLINLLPANYNKEVKDVNYYKLLRSLSFDLADAKIEMEQLKDNLYIDTADKEAIYKNFGVLINLAKKPEWDTETYRRLVKGVSQSLLEGPTPKSIVNAIRLFTSFNVNIYELYKTHKQLDPLLLANVNPQFAFVIEIEKPIGDSSDQNTIYKDVNYVINIVKPAHTISIVIITLLGTENYRQQYKIKNGLDFANSDVLIQNNEVDTTEGIYGWRDPSYEGQFKTLDGNLIANNSITNGGIFLGPRYVLYDQSLESISLGNKYELYHDVNEEMDALLNKISDEHYLWKQDDYIAEYESIMLEPKFGTKKTAFQLNKGLFNRHKLGMGTNLHDELGITFQKIFMEKKMKGFDVVDFAPQDFLDRFHKVAEIGNSQVEFFNTEALRQMKLEGDSGHIHKKMTMIVQNKSQIIKLPVSDVFSIGNGDYDSLTRVYINGKLIEPWAYCEYPISLDLTKCNTIEFYDETIYPGDVVTVTYLKDKTVIMDNFPFIEEYEQVIDVTGENVSWRYFEPDNKFKFNLTPLGRGILWADPMIERHNMEMYKVDASGNVEVVKSVVYIA